MRKSTILLAITALHTNTAKAEFIKYYQGHEFNQKSTVAYDSGFDVCALIVVDDKSSLSVNYKKDSKELEYSSVKDEGMVPTSKTAVLTYRYRSTNEIAGTYTPTISDKNTLIFNNFKLWHLYDARWRLSIEDNGEVLPMPTINIIVLGDGIGAFERCVSEHDLY